VVAIHKVILLLLLMLMLLLLVLVLLLMLLVRNRAHKLRIEKAGVSTGDVDRVCTSGSERRHHGTS
jgi:uncharacterized protein YpmS